MELKRGFNLRAIFVATVWLILGAYLVVGLQPTEAAQYAVAAKLNIPSVGIDSDVTKIELEDHKLNTPSAIVGSYESAENKTFLIGHSTTAFKNLDGIKLREQIIYNDKTYMVTKIQVLPKEKISMQKLLKAAKRDTIVIMTCAGTLLEGGDATARLIVTAVSI